MQSQLPVHTLWRGEQESGGQRKVQTEPCTRRSLVSPLLDPLMALHRKKLVTGLLEHVEEIQEMDDGYSFKFDRSENMIGRVADYILFEGQHSPQLTFTIVEEPRANAFWLQVRSLESEIARCHLGLCLDPHTIRKTQEDRA